jgi:hypothetical protein
LEGMVVLVALEGSELLCQERVRIVVTIFFNQGI